MADSGEAGVSGVAAVSLSAASPCFSGVLSTPLANFSVSSLITSLASYNTRGNNRASVSVTSWRISKVFMQGGGIACQVHQIY